MRKALLMAPVFFCSLLAIAADSGEAVMKADRDFAKATAARRLEGWMEYFADNAVLIDDKPIVGKAAVREVYSKVFENPNFTLEWTPTKGEIFPAGDMGYTTGTFVRHNKNAKGEAVNTTGNYFTVWGKQADGSWKVLADGGTANPQKK